MPTEKLAAAGGTPVRETFLPYSLPQTGEEEKRELIAALESGWITTGPRTKKLEADLAEYTGAAHVLCVDSCTAALHLALDALDLEPGDEVVTSPLTFCSTANTIIHAGGIPVLADVEPDTLNLDPGAAARAITSRTRALLPVHYGGHPCEMDAFAVLAREHGLAVVEDAAHAIGASYRGRKVGTMSDAACFSFYATKNMTTAEGGMLTGDPELIDRARVVSLHGMSRDAWKRYANGGTWRYEVLLPGFKYNMTDVQAALGLQQLRKLPRFHHRRSEVAAQYTEAFSTEDALEVPVTRAGVEHAWHLYVLRLLPEALRIGRDRFIDELVARNIGVSVHFIPVHLHPYYRNRYGYRAEQFPVALASFERMLSLPLHPRLTNRDVADVIEAVLDVAHTYRR